MSKPISEMTLQEMMAEAATFRGELSVPEEPVEARILAAGHRLAWGMEPADVQAQLIEEGASVDEAGLAIAAAMVASRDHDQSH